MAGEVDRSTFELVFSDDFTGDALDAARWIDHYLPHWTTPGRSAARYALNGRGLQLLIEADQPALRTVSCGSPTSRQAPSPAPWARR